MSLGKIERKTDRCGDNVVNLPSQKSTLAQRNAARISFMAITLSCPEEEMEHFLQNIMDI